MNFLSIALFHNPRRNIPERIKRFLSLCPHVYVLLFLFLFMFCGRMRERNYYENNKVVEAFAAEKRCEARFP